MKTVLVLLAMTLSFPLAKAQAPDHPCKKLMEACTAAGFKKGAHKESKGLFKDCLQPIMEGKTVAGVTTNAADIQACQAHKAAHKEKMQH